MRPLAPALVALAFTSAHAQPVPTTPAVPAVAVPPVVIPSGDLAGAVEAVRALAERGAYPGAALAIGRYTTAALEQGVGRVAWGQEAVDPARTRYDLASLTKVVATTTAVMLLVEDGRMALDAPVREYLPEFAAGDGSGEKARVTVRHLLTHTAGLPVGGRGASLFHFLSTRLLRRPGARPQYSDLSMVALWAAAERAAGEPLPALLERRVWHPLGMTATGFLPGAGCAAGGVGRAPDGRPVRVLRAETVQAFARRQPGSGSRALGWDTRGSALVHTGYTGTSLWIDPARGTWAVLLTNRTYQPHTPRAQRLVAALRRTLARWVERAAGARVA